MITEVVTNCSVVNVNIKYKLNENALNLNAVYSNDGFLYTTKHFLNNPNKSLQYSIF